MNPETLISGKIAEPIARTVEKPPDTGELLKNLTADVSEAVEALLYPGHRVFHIDAILGAEEVATNSGTHPQRVEALDKERLRQSLGISI